MATSALKATFTFDNYATRSVTMSPFKPNSSAVNGFKANVKAFNASGYTSVSDTFLYDAVTTLGHVTGIKDAEITTTTQTLVYSKTAYLGERAMKNIENIETEGE